MFVINLSYTRPLQEVDALLDDHVRYLAPYFANQTFLMSGPKVPRTGGVIIANCASLLEMQSIIAQDPFFVAKVASYDIIEFEAKNSVIALGQ